MLDDVSIRRLLAAGGCLLLVAALASGCSEIQDGDGHSDIGSGATPTAAEVEPNPTGFHVVLDVTVRPGGNDNFNNRYLLLSPSTGTSTEAAIQTESAELTKQGWKLVDGSGTRKGTPDCVAVGTPKTVFGPVLLQPNTSALNAAVNHSQPGVVAVSLGEC